MNQEFRLKKIDEIINYLIEEISQNELMSKKHEKTCKILKYIEHLLVIISTITRCVFISAFASLVRISIAVTSSAIEAKICVITTAIKKYKCVDKKKRKA